MSSVAVKHVAICYCLGERPSRILRRMLVGSLNINSISLRVHGRRSCDVYWSFTHLATPPTVSVAVFHVRALIPYSFLSISHVGSPYLRGPFGRLEIGTSRSPAVVVLEEWRGQHRSLDSQSLACMHGIREICTKPWRNFWLALPPLLKLSDAELIVSKLSIVITYSILTYLFTDLLSTYLLTLI